MDDVQVAFRKALLDAVDECRKIGYRPNRFVGMISNSDPFAAVRALLYARETSEGFTTLWEKKRLDLSVEAIVLRPEWCSHFSDEELAIAKSRLADVQYQAQCAEADGANPKNPEIRTLLEQLAAAKGDRSTSKKIRIRLRSLGHRGGLRAADVRSELAGGGPARSQEIKTILPPISEAEVFLERIRSLRGLPERNHEDAVKDLLVRLGFDPSAIVFQRGRIDVSVHDESGKILAVFEVKRTLASAAERAAARRQGMDYACQTSAAFIILSDGDRYEIYDRRKSMNYDEMLCGKFQLTAFREQDSAVLELLRPVTLSKR